MENKKKILFICQYFYPENFRGNDVAFDLAKDNDVHVVCGVPNYPMGKFYKGYSWFKRRHEVVNGVKVTRLPIFPRGNNGALMLMLNYFSYMIVGWIYILFHAITHKYDMVFVQQLSPVMMTVPGVLYKKLRRIPLYTWALDLWPESLEAAGGINNKYILKFFAHYVKMEYKWSDKILVSSRSFVNSIKQYGDYESKVIFYPQWAEDAITRCSKRVDVPTLPDGFKIMFAGAVGEAQDFDHVMEAACLIKEHKNIKWVIVGDGRKFEWVKDFIRDNQLEETVLTMGRYPVDAMSGLFNQADLMLVCLKDTQIFRLTAPAKIQAYMASGKPIIAMLNGEGASVIAEAQCGWSVSAENAVELANAVIEIVGKSPAELQQKGANGLAYYKANFTKTTCLENLRKIMGLC